MEAANFSRPQIGDQTSLTFEQTGKAGRMVGLCLKILLLSLVTLTLYRFWARTQVRRYLWGHTLISGEPLDYTGKGSELLIGFLIALVLYLLPLGIAINAYNFLPPGASGGPSPTAIALTSTAYAALYYLMIVGLYQALRYRLSRTVWRGIRFSLKGSAFGFGLKFLGLAIANVLLLGFLTPVMDVALFGAVAKNAQFGDKSFRFEGKARSLYGPFLLTYLLVVLLIAGIVAVAAMAMSAAGVMPDTSAGPPNAQQMLKLLPYIVAGYFAFGLVFMVLTSFYTAQSLRVKARGLRFEGLSFALDAKTFSYLWLLFTNMLLILLTLGIALPIAELRMFKYIFNRLSADGTIDLGTIGQSTGPRPRFGEGLAEAFGMGNV